MAPGNQYRKLLKELADNLTLSDVGSLKFICRDKIATGRLCKIPNEKPLEFLKLLEEGKFITSDNLTLLRVIFKQIQRVDLAVKIPEELCPKRSLEEDVPDSGGVSLGSSIPVFVDDVDLVSPYTALLKSLADELTNSNIEEMMFLLDVPDGIGEKIKDGESLFTYLEGSGDLSQNNFTQLKNLLSDIYRKDLIKKIDDFSINFAQPVPRLPAREAAMCYPMAQPPHGYALIINIKTFSESKTDKMLGLKERKGSDVDFKNLKELWSKLGFIVEGHQELKAHKIYKVVVDMSKKIDKDSTCFVCCIMTHGAMGKIYGSDSNTLDIREITDFFKEGNCPALAGKPKLFFIQACRGTQHLITGRATNPTQSQGFEITHTATPETHSTLETGQSPGLDSDAYPAAAAAIVEDDDNINDSTFRHNADPNETHFLLGYSTAPGFVSFRSVDHGTWYVNAMVRIFSQYYETEDLLSMMVMVNRQVDDAYTSKGYKQCPVPVLTLTKKVYF